MEVPCADLPGDTAHSQLVEQEFFGSGDMHIAPMETGPAASFREMPISRYMISGTSAA